MAEEIKLVRDFRGSPVPQIVSVDGTTTVKALGDIDGIDFGLTQLIRDELESPIPNQIFDVAQNKWVIDPNPGGGSGGVSGVSSVNNKTGAVTLNAADVGAASTTELQTTNGNLTELERKTNEHLAQNDIHRTSSQIRNEATTSLRTEVVSSLPTSNLEKGRIVFLDDAEPSFKGYDGGKWV